MDSKSFTLPDRLRTFDKHWETDEDTARQLAGIGHVYVPVSADATEEGSKCVECGIFIRRQDSVSFLNCPIKRKHFEVIEPAFHRQLCRRSQNRIPIETWRVYSDSELAELNEIRQSVEEIVPAQPNSTTPVIFNNPDLSFLTLPPEIREEIYGMALPSLGSTTEIIQPYRDSTKILTEQAYNRRGRRDLTQTNILRTCRTVYSEALDSLYHNRTYKCVTTKVLYLFLRIIGRNGRNLLRAVDVNLGTPDDTVTLSLLATCPRLHSLTVTFFRPSLLWAPLVPVWILDGTSALFEISGLKDVKYIVDTGEEKHDPEPQVKDEAVVIKELTRPRGAPSGLQWKDGRPILW